MALIARNFSEIPSRGAKSAESPAGGSTKSYWILAATSACPGRKAMIAPAMNSRGNLSVVMTVLLSGSAISTEYIVSTRPPRLTGQSFLISRLMRCSGVVDRHPGVADRGVGSGGEFCHQTAVVGTSPEDGVSPRAPDGFRGYQQSRQ